MKCRASVSNSDQHCATLWSLLQKALPGENLLLTLANNSLPIASIKVSPLNDMMFGIHPVHSMSCIVNGQSIGPEEVRVRNDAPIRAIHVGILNAGSVAPVSPVDSTGGGRERQLENLWPTYCTQHHFLSGQKHYQSCDLEHETGSQPQKK